MADCYAGSIRCDHIKSSDGSSRWYISRKFIGRRVYAFCSSDCLRRFGIWTIRGDSLDEADESPVHSPFLTVMIAFFLAEMGDKTQLATITLAAEYQSIWMVLSGSTIGMLIADGVGVVLGVAVQQKIPERALQIFAATIFLSIGVTGICDYLF